MSWYTENNTWDFFGRNDYKAETPVLWPPHANGWLIGKDFDAGRWRLVEIHFIWMEILVSFFLTLLELWAIFISSTVFCATIAITALFLPLSFIRLIKVWVTWLLVSPFVRAGPSLQIWNVIQWGRCRSAIRKRCCHLIVRELQCWVIHRPLLWEKPTHIHLPKQAHRGKKRNS